MSESIGWNPDTFTFTSDFQTQMLAALIQEPKIFERIGLLLDPKFFEIQEFANVITHIQKYYNKYKGIPTKEILIELVSNKKDDDSTIIDTIDVIYSYKRLSSSTLEFIEESVKNFISCQALKRAVCESLDDLGDIDKHLNVRDRIEKALLVGSNIDDLGMNAYSNDEIIKRVSARQKDEEIIRYKVGWEEFDSIFGGFGAGELFTFGGPAHSGKSMYLVNIGAGLLLNKKNVVHITLEMSEQITVQRYDMRLLGLTKQELKSKHSIEKIKELIANRIGTLTIKRYPMRTCTAHDISLYLKRLENTKEIKTDALIVDYADIMKSLNKYYEFRHEVEAIYQQLRNVAIEFNIPVITGTQLNRGALGKLQEGKTLTEEDIAEAYGVARIVDGGVMINATAMDNANNTSSLYVFKNRDGEAGQKLKMYVDFSKALVKPWSGMSTQFNSFNNKKPSSVQSEEVVI